MRSTKVCIALASILCLVNNCSSEQQTVFKAHLSEGWYHTDTAKLQQQLVTLDNKAAKRFAAHADPNNIRAFIVPHAGYGFSGEVAAAAYRLLKGATIARVIILAPSHSVPFVGVALPHYTQYQTPLGQLAIDTATVSNLAVHPLFSYHTDVWSREHSLEVQLPWIQYYLPQASIVPLIIGNINEQQARAIAQVLTPLLDKKTIVIISSDFIHHGDHFGYAPFKGKGHVQERIKRRDARVLQTIQAGALNNFLATLNQTGATVCGRMPIAVLLALLEEQALGIVQPRLVAYTTSFEKTGDAQNSVSYASLMFTQEKRNELPLQQQLTQYEKTALLKLARKTLENVFAKNIDTDLLIPIETPAIAQSMGAFVTLYKNGNLRGCIGTIIGRQPLYKTVAAMTKAAAFNDPRFKPLTQDELKNVRISISVLTIPQAISSYHGIERSKHGIILQSNGKSAVFLPKVPVDLGWDIPKTLEQLSIKAGLSADAWQHKKTQFTVFESIDFDE